MRPRSRRSAIEPAQRPSVVAHRGASSDVPEHTLAAYVAAISSGADALECDVRLTRDGHLVCVHDRTVNRTSDGHGVVSELDLPGLAALDFASWRGDLPGSADQLLNDSPYLAGVAPDRVDSGGGVLTLELLLGLVADQRADGRDLRLLIETKHPTRYGGLVEKELVEMLSRFGWAGEPPDQPSVRLPADRENPVTVMSFAPIALRRVKLQAPQIPTVLLLDRLLPVRRDGFLPVGVAAAGPGVHVLRAEPEFVAKAHARGYPVYVWTVDRPQDVEFVLDLGVDTVITDRPREVIAEIDRRLDPAEHGR